MENVIHDGWSFLFVSFSSSLMLLINKVCLRILLLVGSAGLLQRVRADAAVELLLVLLLLTLDERWYLRDHIRGRTRVLGRKLPGGCGRALASTLRDEALGVQLRAHNRHARVLAHLGRVAL